MSGLVHAVIDGRAVLLKGPMVARVGGSEGSHMVLFMLLPQYAEQVGRGDWQIRPAKRPVLPADPPRSWAGRKEDRGQGLSRKKRKTTDT